MKDKNVKKKFVRAVAVAMTAAMANTAVFPVLAEEASAEQTQQPALAGLKVEGKAAPMGVDTTTPVFSWQMDSDVRGALQTSYQITVDKASDGTRVWDSGKVESGDSLDIAYEGEELEACTVYNWTVTVEDNSGNVLTETAAFETSKLSTSLDAWNGAKWIGADELSLDAAAATLFDISTRVRIPEGSEKASVIFGADDFRYKNELFNLYQLEGENYFRFELDVTNAGTEEGAAIHIYRVGFFEEDSAETPYLTIDLANCPITNLNELITAENKNQEHELSLSMQTCTLTVSIDGTAVITGETENAFTGETSPSADIVLADWGNSDVMSVPNLNSIGFAAEAGETAVFTDFALQNPGYGTGTLFDDQTGATYRIWEGEEGVSIDGNVITVEGGENGVLCYADPSYGSEPYLRTEFELKDDIESARLYLSFQGIGNFYINGEEVAPDEWFKQGSMEYREEIGYNVYDVTEYVASGPNAMGAVMGEGWWTGHAEIYDDKIYNYYGDREALLVNLVVTYADGSEDILISDDSTWQYYGDGPVRLASLFEGERYYATKEAAVEGFSTTDYEEETAGWRSAQVIETRTAFADQKLVVREDEAVHVIRELDAVLVGETKEGSGSYIYDFGENVAAVPQITIPEEYAKEGETITIRVAEILYPELEEYGELAGNLLQENYRAALSTDFYTMRSGEQTYTPNLTFHGYRYLEITGLDEALPAENVKSLALSSIDNTATYDSSNELVNRLFLNGQNSEASNHITLPTDCPQRNERMGWMGDANVYALAGSYNADTYQFMRQWLNCVRESQGEDGMTSHTSPNYPSYDGETGEVNVGGMSFGITWNSAIVFIPYYLYEQYGDTTILDENLDAIYKYMENLEANPLTYGTEEAQVTEPALTAQTGFLCDHLSVVSTDGEMLGNALYTHCLDAVSQMAEAVGQKEKAEKYASMYEAAKTAWNSIYIDRETGKSCKSDGTILHTQASYASPLNYGVVSEENIGRFVDNFVDTIENPKADDGSDLVPYTLTTGFNATPNLLNALSGNGRADVAYKMLECTEYASWLYPVVQGATSIWERWNSYTVEDGFGGNNGMNSFNHYSLGAVTSWMMDSQLGIRYDETNPGYKHFILQPVAGGTFTYAKGSFQSAYGTIYSGWEAEDGMMSVYEASVPANTTATLYLPVSEEAAAGLSIPEGAEYMGMTEHNGQTCAQYELVSGSYRFEITE